MKLDNESVERVEYFKYFGRTQKINIPFRKKLTAD
jgi:hypothetical protein